VGGTLSALSTLLDEGADARVVRRQLVGHLRSALVTAAGVELPGLSGLESLAGAGVEKLLRWLSALVEVKPHGADDRTGVELALVRAVIGPQVAATPGMAAVLPEAVQEQAAARSSSRISRQVAGPPVMEPRPERPTGRLAGADRLPAREDTGSEAAIPEPSPPVCADRPPAILRQLDALQARWDEVLAGLGRSGHTQIQALLRSCSPVAVDDRQVVVAARYGFHRSRLESGEARRVVEGALAAVIGEPVELRVVLADGSDAPNPSQAAGGQDGVSLPSGLPPELADDPLLRVAVQEVGAVGVQFRK
jgi:DNA polymerase-3 subunit gamma/tau